VPVALTMRQSAAASHLCCWTTKMQHLKKKKIQELLFLLYAQFLLLL
jgi:hypothetical protein